MGMSFLYWLSQKLNSSKLKKQINFWTSGPQPTNMTECYHKYILRMECSL